MGTRTDTSGREIYTEATDDLYGSVSNPTYTQSTALPAGTDRSGTAQTTAGGAVLAALNTSRRGLNIQNIGANNIGFTENGTDPVIGAAGTYTITPGNSASIRTNRQVKVIAATGATPFSATEF